ncbi:DUF4282 domain-containing protein [Novosphingobium sp. ZN18A2]|uniref:DUF4282 domain-containing protein n=1 Tax=Novosphingobium sp. ZN18A2 TaxID=3079861 RepID=UPI0030CE92B6
MEKDFSISDLGNFEKLVTPKVIKIIYWLGLVGMAIFALITFAGALGMMRYSFATGVGTILLSVVGFGFGVLFWRVLMEVYMVFFGIYDRLGDIREDLRKE